MIDDINQHPNLIDTDSLSGVDSKYEEYKKYYADARALVFVQRRFPVSSAQLSKKHVQEYSDSQLATHKSSKCANPNADATTKKALEPDYPDVARQNGAVGALQVKVCLDASGSVTDAVVMKSSGNAELDDSALTAAKGSSFSPEIANCVPVPSAYIFRSDFTGQ